MKKASKFFLCGLVAIMLGVLTVNSMIVGNSASISVPSLDVIEADVTSFETGNFDQLGDLIPETYEETEIKMRVRNRFLMWTYDGVHVMWGYYGNGFFIGMDNLGKRAWGIYGKDVFAGLYDGQFFWGKYRQGYWRAVDLFGEDHTYGRYELFPIITPVQYQIVTTLSKRIA